MTMTTIKLVSVLKGLHVHTSMFVGPTDRTLAYTGAIVNDIDGYEALTTALRLGANIATERVLLILDEDGRIAELARLATERDNLGMELP